MSRMTALHQRAGHREFQLTTEVIARSVAATWNEAKHEWALSGVYFTDADEPGVCLCGHTPIREHVVLVNRMNGTRVVVGNVCVSKFLGLVSEPIFASLRRVVRNRSGALSVEAVELAHRLGWVTDWELTFYRDTRRKRSCDLSPRQLAVRVRVNETVLRRAKRG